MANSRLCTIPGCGKQHNARGWCKNHYKRFMKYGNPLAGNLPRGTALAYFNEILNYTGDDCTKWPYNRDKDGYAKFWYDGKSQLVHRVVCSQIYGDKPTPDHEVAHSCGNGHLGCANPKHLRWATRAENRKDKVLHGTILRGEKSPGAKLTEANVVEIRSLIGTMPFTDISKLFDVSPTAIECISTGKNWGWLK